MQITSVEAIPLEHDLGAGNGLSGNRGITNTRPATLVRLIDVDGIVG